MIGNRSYLTDYKEIDGGFVAFGGNSRRGKITGKDKIRTGKLDFEDVYFVKDLKFNLLSVSQMCDKKNSVLFTDTECVVLSPDFKLIDESNVLLKVLRKDNMYSVDLKNVVPQGGLTCLFAKATPDESTLWHRRLGHINFKTMNKLVRGNLGIKREFSVPMTSQQNGVAERKNRTLIEAARTMLADSKLLTTFWAKAVNTACYVQNRVLVIKRHNKTPYELFLGYSTNSKAFRVFKIRTRIMEENLHVKFSKNTSNIAGSRPNWLFDIDTLTKSMNYKLVVEGNQSNDSAGTKACDNVRKARVKTVPDKDYILLPLWTQDLLFSYSSKDSPDAGFKPSGEEEKKDTKDPGNENSEVPSTVEPRVNQEKDENVNSTNNVNTVSPTDNAAGVKQYDDLLAKPHQTEFKASTYKRGLNTVEAQLFTYRNNESLKKLSRKKEGINFKIEKFENASKDLDKLLGSQITDNSKKGLGYHAVPPPHPLIYNSPTKLDLSYSGLEEFKHPEFEGYGVDL
ncbi:ribonuclease H-like domain-containing protein [Tanacetum coccineum]